MSKRKVRLFLADMLESIEKIQRYTAGVNFERFVSDDLLVDAVVRNLEIIGEAARYIPKTPRRPYPEFPWKRVVGLRNIYFAVDLEIVWTIIRENLAALKDDLQKMLTDLEAE